LTVPAGTQLTWTFRAKNADTLAVRLGNEVVMAMPERSEAKKAEGTTFTLNHRVFKSLRYGLQTRNRFTQSADSVSYALTVIPDQYPDISATERSDSTQSDGTVFFVGRAGDDYGLSKITFNYTLTAKGAAKPKSTGQGPIQVERGATGQAFYYAWNRLGLVNQGIELAPGDELTYWFEAWDNDGVSGPKRTKSRMMAYRLPTDKELDQRANASSQAIQDLLSQSLGDVRKLQRDTEKLRQKLRDKPNMSFEDKKAAEQLKKQGEQLQDRLEEAQRLQRQSREERNALDQPTDEEVLRKQEKLQEMFDQNLSEEVKQLVKDLQKLMEQKTPQQTQKELDDIKLSNKEIEKELDRMSELFKQLELEQKLKDAAADLQELAGKQEELGQKSEEGKQSKESLEAEQKYISERFEELMDKLEEAEKENEAMEEPAELGD